MRGALLTLVALAGVGLAGYGIFLSMRKDESDGSVGAADEADLATQRATGASGFFGSSASLAKIVRQNPVELGIQIGGVA